MTVSERNNAALFIQYTTVRPFIFMGSCFKCLFCKEYSTDVSIILEHTLTHKICGRSEILEKYIPKGKRALQVDISKLKCRLCNQTYAKLDFVREHLVKDHDKQFYLSSNGMIEYNLDLNNGFFTCHICSKNVPSFSQLNLHMNCHVGKVVCENCGASFLHQHLLLKHKEIHLVDKLKCQFCDKMFLKKSQLKYHNDIVHKGKDRVKLKKCPYCKLTFKEHYSKMMHLKRAHGVSKSYECHECKVNFSTRRSLTEHITKQHTEKFKCEICSKCFSIKSKLQQHMRGHTGDKTFSCPICKNAYMHKMTLRRHLKIHKSSFDFLCFKCGSGFNTRNEYTDHMKVWHSKDRV